MKKQKLRRNGAKIMAKLIVLLGSLTYIMVLAVINGSLGFLSAMGVTVFGAIAIAKGLGENIILSWGAIIALTVVCGVIRGALRYFEQYSNHYIAFRLLAVLRDKIFKALRILCPAKLESKQKGSIIAMITSDIETLEVFYAHTISPICIAVLVSLCVFLFVGFFSSWYLALIAVFGYLTIGIIIPCVYSSKIKKYGVAYRKEFASFNAYFLDSIKGIKDIVLNNNGEEREKQVNQKSQKLLCETKNMKKNTTRATAFTELVMSIFIVLSVVVGILLVLTNVLSVGKMIVGVVTIFASFGPVLAVSALPGNLTQTLASGDRVLDLLEEKPVVQEVVGKQDFDFENLKIRGLSFGYTEDTKVLEDINFTVKKGQIVGIVGDSGCGKSTLLKLLLRFWQKSTGSIQYNDIDIDNINTKSLLNNVCMVSQSTYLFDESIEDNLRIAKPNATVEEIEDACKKASIDEFIKSLPNGYQTKVGAMGDNLSAGEKQRIGLARAFLKGSQLILLDEPTSNVDSINEGIILQSLLNQKSQKSIILVSHRESTMAIADNVLKMNNGKIEEVV